jgi:hypothetical protein
VAVQGPRRRWQVLVILAAVAAGAVWYVRAFHPGLPNHRASLSEALVLRLAGEAARREKIDLSQYQAPQIHFGMNGTRPVWTVMYSEKPDPNTPIVSGAFFTVTIDDDTQSAVISGGV